MEQRHLADCEFSEVEASGPYSQSAGILYYLGNVSSSFIISLLLQNLIGLNRSSQVYCNIIAGKRGAKLRVMNQSIVIYMRLNWLPPRAGL